MKTIFKKAYKIILICSLILLSSCEAEKIHTKNSKFTIRKFSMKEAKRKGDSKLINAVDKIKNHSFNIANENTRIIYDEASGLYFDDEKGLYISDGEKKSYTFPIIRTSSLDKVQNICFNLKSDGSYDVFLVAYDFTKEEAQGMTDQEIANKEKQFIALMKDGQVVTSLRYVCIDVLAVVTQEISVPIDQGDLTGNFGYTTVTQTSVITIASGCFWSGETDDTSGGDSGSGSDGSNYGGGGNTDGGGIIGSDSGGIIDDWDDTLITGSIIDDTEAQVITNMPFGWYLKYFEKNLDEQSLAIYNAHPELRQYLEINNCDYSSRVFVLDMINALMDNCSIFNPDNFDNNITTNLPPCLTNVINDLKSLQNGKFGQVISQFAGTSPVPLNYNWTVNTASLGPNVIAQTNPTIQGGVATTTINSDFTNISTDLSIAKTLIHECFHAYLNSVYRYRNIDANYATLVNQYSAQFNNNANDIHHHIYTINNIVNEISLALKEYGVSKGYNLPQQFYDDMAWGGLYGTNVYNALPQSQRDRIESTIEAEFRNSNNSIGNVLGLNPRGIQICP